MSLEASVAAAITIPGIQAVLTGGIYVFGNLSPEGITLATEANAFDGDGYLKPIAIVKQRGIIPNGNVVDYEGKAHSFNQIIEIWLYQRVLYDQIDLAVQLIFQTLQGEILDDTFEMSLANMLDRQRDGGVLQDASMVRMDFAISGVLVF